MENEDSFERFSEQARQVLKLAEEEARSFQHGEIGTEHMLLGVLREGESGAAGALEALGVTLERLWKAVEEVKGRGSAPVDGEIGFSAHAEMALELAMKAGERQFPARGDKTSRPLMGSIHLSEDEAAKMVQDGKLTPHMEALGITLEQVRRGIQEAQGRGVQLLFDQRAPINTPTAEAERRRHPLFRVSTEHLLRGVLRVAEGTGTTILRGWGVASISEVSALMFANHGTLPLTYREYELHFTGLAGRAWSLAHEEACRLGDSYVGGTHLLLGLLEVGTGIAATALSEQGINLASLREQIKPGYNAGDWDQPQSIKLQPRLKNVIELAANEARRRHQSFVNTGHLLLALVRKQDDHGYEAGLLKSQGADMERLRATLRRRLAEHNALTEEEAESVDDGGGDAAVYAAGASVDVIENGLQSRELDKMLLALYPFTIEARFVLEHARLSATNREQPVGPEDLLAGLAYLGISKDTRMSKILADTGVQFGNVQKVLKDRPGQQGKAAAPILVHSALGRACILLAADEAERRDGPGSPIKSEHLLLGLLREEKGVIADLLTELGTSVEALRARAEAMAANGPTSN
ncbi:Clp protease N-terminal domain-containing protein [Dictyobacter halimunensis]